jgi:hypothetical protein
MHPYSVTHITQFTEDNIQQWLCRRFHHDRLNKTENVAVAPLDKAMAATLQRINLHSEKSSSICAESTYSPSPHHDHSEHRWAKVLSKQGFSLFRKVKVKFCKQKLAIYLPVHHTGCSSSEKT